MQPKFINMLMNRYNKMMKNISLIMFTLVFSFSVHAMEAPRHIGDYGDWAAYVYKENGKKVLMVAGDTFRAAASDQLTEWSKRVNCRIVKYNEGVDPGAVVFDGIASAKAKGDDVVLVDTAGRLHNKANLMDELKKISKIVDKEWEGKVLNYLVIDATTGQNALSQVKTFNEIIGLDGIILTKLDGTAKGGIVFAIAKEYGIPVRFVGLGEGIDDLQVFNAKEFVDNLL